MNTYKRATPVQTIDGDAMGYNNSNNTTKKKHTYKPTTLFGKHNKLTRILESVKQPARKRVVAFPFFTFPLLFGCDQESAPTAVTVFSFFSLFLFTWNALNIHGMNIHGSWAHGKNVLAYNLQDFLLCTRIDCSMLTFAIGRLLFG